jgi:beta-galactosidase
VSAQMRSDGAHCYRFVMNFGAETVSVDLGASSYRDLLTGNEVSGEVSLESYGVLVLSDDAPGPA